MSSTSSLRQPSKDKGVVDTAQNLEKFTKPVLEVLTFVIPLLIVWVRFLYEEFLKLPQNALLFLYGSVFCFFGGSFPTLFAALQAAEHGGRATVLAALSDLSSEAMIIIEESKKDDSINEKQHGKLLTGQELFTKKAHLVMKKMNPEKIDKAIRSLYSVWVAVIAVLKVRFARTISMALSIAEFLEVPTTRFILPVVQASIPNEYERWIPILISWAIKALAMSIVWYVQSVVSAFASALQGGLMMARAALKFCHAHHYTFGGLIEMDHRKTSLDEVLSLVFATLGFYTQFREGFRLPFPLNLLLWPFEIAEYYIRWTLTSK